MNGRRSTPRMGPILAVLGALSIIFVAPYSMKGANAAAPNYENSEVSMEVPCGSELQGDQIAVMNMPLGEEELPTYTSVRLYSPEPGVYQLAVVTPAYLKGTRIELYLLTPEGRTDAYVIDHDPGYDFMNIPVLFGEAYSTPGTYQLTIEHASDNPDAVLAAPVTADFTIPAVECERPSELVVNPEESPAPNSDEPSASQETPLPVPTDTASPTSSPEPTADPEPSVEPEPTAVSEASNEIVVVKPRPEAARVGADSELPSVVEKPQPAEKPQPQKIEFPPGQPVVLGEHAVPNQPLPASPAAQPAQPAQPAPASPNLSKPKAGIPSGSLVEGEAVLGRARDMLSVTTKINKSGSGRLTAAEVGAIKIDSSIGRMGSRGEEVPLLAKKPIMSRLSDEGPSDFGMLGGMLAAVGIFGFGFVRPACKLS